jgi:enoyl-CoA hydratase/carnithine racemase
MSVDATMNRGVLRLSIHVPESRNALDLSTIAALRKALSRARDNPDLRLVQIESAIARVFSIGMDLEKLNTRPDAGVWENFAAIADYADLLIDLAVMPVTTLAIVDGVAAAGGVELACICDTVIGTSNAAFSIAQLRKGIFPFITSAVLVPRIGQSRFLHWALSGQTFSARKLLELGLINQLCAPEELERTTSIFVDRVLGFDPATLKAGVTALRSEAEVEIRGRIRHALSLFTLNCLALRGTAK